MVLFCQYYKKLCYPPKKIMVHFFKNLSFYYIYLKLFLFLQSTTLFANYIRDTEIELALSSWSLQPYKN